jgi:hypothetical protein
MYLEGLRGEGALEKYELIITFSRGELKSKELLISYAQINLRKLQRWFTYHLTSEYLLHMLVPHLCYLFHVYVSCLPY